MSNIDMAFQQISEIRNQLRCLGARPAHEQRILRLWSQAKPQNSGSRPLESFMPAALRQALPQLSEKLSTLLRLQSTHPEKMARCVGCLRFRMVKPLKLWDCLAMVCVCLRKLVVPWGVSFA